MLYYRTDLLQKYGFSEPPQTWDELEQMARTIQDGERQAGNPNFYGYVFQGNAYEGLTCNVVEWVASTTGHGVLQNGQLAMDDPQVIEIFNKAQGWVGTIAPRGVTGYQEDQSNNVFAQGNAAFLRNWPYAYATGNQDTSPIKGKFDVAPLPHAEGQQPVGTVGGWQVAVSNYSNNKEAAVEWVRYLTSPQVQTYRAVIGSFVPTIPTVAEDAAVVQAMPFLPTFDNVTRVPRPSAELRDRYNQGSTYIFQAGNLILTGQDPASVLQEVEPQFNRILSQ
jgi:trehalose/maltose transport system substrate-binding protein